MKSLGEKNEHCIDVCNSLLRGEISAVETYNQAIDKFSAEREAPTLRSIRDDHAASVRELEENVVSMGGHPRSDSGAWGTFAKGVQATANLLGEDSAVNSLQKGEQHGRKEYLDALEDDQVMPTCKELIRSSLLPRVNRHIDTLEQVC